MRQKPYNNNNNGLIKVLVTVTVTVTVMSGFSTDFPQDCPQDFPRTALRLVYGISTGQKMKDALPLTKSFLPILSSFDLTPKKPLGIFDTP